MMLRASSTPLKITCTLLLQFGLNFSYVACEIRGVIVVGTYHMFQRATSVLSRLPANLAQPRLVCSGSGSRCHPVCGARAGPGPTVRPRSLSPTPRGAAAGGLSAG